MEKKKLIFSKNIVTKTIFYFVLTGDLIIIDNLNEIVLGNDLIDNRRCYDNSKHKGYE